MNSNLNKKQPSIPHELKETIWETIFWPYSLFKIIKQKETTTENLRGFFYWGRLWPIKKYFLNRNKDILLAKYPDLTSEQIEYISGWSFECYFVPLIWSVKSRLNKFGIIFALNYLIIALGLVTYSFIQNYSSELIQAFSFLFMAVIIYLTIALRIYFQFNAKRLSWEQGWLNFVDFKSSIDSLEKRLWRSIIAVLVIILILVFLLAYILNT